MRQVFVFAALLLFARAAQAGVGISNRFTYNIWSHTQIQVPAGQMRAWQTSIATLGQITVDVRVLNQNFNDGSFWVCNSAGYAALNTGQATNDCRGMNRQRGHFRFTYAAPVAGTYFLVADNRFSMMLTKDYEVTVDANIETPPKIRQTYGKLLQLISRAVRVVYRAPGINFYIKPCGVNAFSQGADGSIIICTGLIEQLYKQNNSYAMVGIIFHELGHSLLNLWGMPDWANEQTADEFSAYMLMRFFGDQFVRSEIRFFAGQNTQAEVQNMIRNGDTHPLSIQRVRNLEAILNNRVGFMERWDNVLYPHMTNTALQSIEKSPATYDNPSLAQQILASR